MVTLDGSIPFENCVEKVNTGQSPVIYVSSHPKSKSNVYKI